MDFRQGIQHFDLVEEFEGAKTELIEECETQIETLEYLIKEKKKSFAKLIIEATMHPGFEKDRDYEDIDQEIRVSKQELDNLREFYYNLEHI